MTARYTDLGVRPVVNAAATLTRLGGSRMPPPVLEAMHAAAESFVDMVDLQQRVGQRIAELTGNDACYVSSGAAAGIAITISALIAGSDADAIAAMPRQGESTPEVLMFRSQRNGYAQAARLPGTRMIEIDDSEGALEAALGPRSVCVLYFAGLLAATSPRLEAVIELAHARNVAVLVDAAAQIPPLRNLSHFTCDLGADAAIFSGGKGLRGPQASGLVFGRQSLIDACARNGPPNHSLGRPMKVGKEEMLGILAAVEWSLQQDEAAVLARYETIVERWLTGLRDVSDIAVERGYPSEAGQPHGRAIVRLLPTNRWTQADLVDALWNAHPRIAVGQIGADAIALNPQTLDSGEDELVLNALRTLLLAND